MMRLFFLGCLVPFLGLSQALPEGLKIDTSSKPKQPKQVRDMRKFKEIVLFKDQGDKLDNLIREID